MAIRRSIARLKKNRNIIRTTFIKKLKIKADEHDKSDAKSRIRGGSPVDASTVRLGVFVRGESLSWRECQLLPTSYCSLRLVFVENSAFLTPTVKNN